MYWSPTQQYHGDLSVTRFTYSISSFFSGVGFYLVAEFSVGTPFSWCHFHNWLWSPSVLITQEQFSMDGHLLLLKVWTTQISLCVFLTIST
jgi:hypothetical protein